MLHLLRLLLLHVMLLHAMLLLLHLLMLLPHMYFVAAGAIDTACGLLLLHVALWLLHIIFGLIIARRYNGNAPYGLNVARLVMGIKALHDCCEQYTVMMGIIKQTSMSAGCCALPDKGSWAAAITKLLLFMVSLLLHVLLVLLLHFLLLYVMLMLCVLLLQVL